MLRKYIHHCATLIQKTYRGYIIKKKYRIALAKMYRFQEIVGAMVCGKYKDIVYRKSRMEDKEDTQKQKNQENNPRNTGNGAV